MSGASRLAAQLLTTADSSARGLLYQRAEQDYGKSFADHLRDTVEAHHFIVDNERAAGAAARARRMDQRRGRARP